MRYELTTWEEDELEFDRCLQAARDKLTWSAKDVAERRAVSEGFNALSHEDDA